MAGSAGPEGILGRVFVSTACWAASFIVIIVVLPFRFQELGFSIAQYGLVLAAYALGMLITETLWGVVAFRLARPRPILGLGLIVVIATLVLGISQSFTVIALAAAALGAFGVFLAPLMRWLALSARGPGGAGSGTGRLATFFGIGLVAGTTAGPVLFGLFGFALVVVVSVVLYVGSLLLVAFLPWQTAGLPPLDAGPVRWFRGVVGRHFLAVSSLVFLYFTALTLPSNFLQYYSTVLFQGTPPEAGYVLGGFRFTALLASFELGVLVDRWGAVRSTLAGFLLLLAGVLGTFLARSYAEMVTATLVFAGGSGWLTAALLPLALRRVAASQQGTAIGLFGSVEDLGLLVGPVLIGSLWTVLGPQNVFLIVAAVCLAGFAFSLVLRDTSTVPKGTTITVGRVA